MDESIRHSARQPDPAHAKFTMAHVNGKNSASASASASASRGTKRPRADSDGNTSEELVGPDAIAFDCPFQVETFREAPTDSDSKIDDMSIVYTVRPAAMWESMGRFKNFSGWPVNDKDFAIHDDVYITRYFTRLNQATDGTASLSEEVEAEVWAARVLEIKGHDQEHVYLRVMWFYLPENLPHGREEYHGDNELIASNDMSIVDGSGVIGLADIPRWIESDEDQPPKPDSPFWRQTYDKITGRLSELPMHCTCYDFRNPDAPLIHCTDPDCAVRMHQHCIHEEFEESLYAQEWQESDAARFPPGTMFKVRIVNFIDPYNHRDDVDPPRLRVTDYRTTPPEVWEQEILCLKCEEPLA